MIERAMLNGLADPKNIPSRYLRISRRIPTTPVGPPRPWFGNEVCLVSLILAVAWTTYGEPGRALSMADALT